MNNPGITYYKGMVTMNEIDTILASSFIQDSKTRDFILKLVNAGKERKTMNIDLSGLKKINSEAEMTILTGDSEEENTIENPDKVVHNISDKNQIKV